MSRMRHLLRQFIKEVFQSHSVEPDVGDLVQNVNPNCKHHGSKGDVLEKTMDQLSSLELSGIY